MKCKTHFRLGKMQSASILRSNLLSTNRVYPLCTMQSLRLSLVRSTSLLVDELTNESVWGKHKSKAQTNKQYWQEVKIYQRSGLSMSECVQDHTCFGLRYNDKNGCRSEMVTVSLSSTFTTFIIYFLLFQILGYGIVEWIMRRNKKMY